MKILFEVVKVIIHGEEYDVHIHELGTWSIDIEDSDSYTSYIDSIVDDDDHNEEEYESEVEIDKAHQEEKREEVVEDKNKIDHKKDSLHRQFVIFGDLNEVRDERERYGKKMSKLDHFLGSHSVTDTFPDLKVTALFRGWSYHTLLLLHYEKADYGPVSFKIFHSWLQRDGFNECIENAYAECSQGNTRMMFYDKLKSKSPGPDGFSILFLKTYWDLLKDDVVEAVRNAFDSFVISKDVVMIISDWNRQDVDNIIRILHVFYLASGLKLNISKSHVYGLGVSSIDIDNMACDMGCTSGNISFSYLGLSIGSNINLLANWHPLTDRFRACWRICNDAWAWNWNRQSIGSRNVAGLEALVSKLGHVSLSNRLDAWSWNISDDDNFYVQATRTHIANGLLPSLSPSTRWFKLLPRKVNVFIWRLILDNLPNRLNLSLRGLEISSITCPSCNIGMESNDHVFFGCETASSIWCLVRVWTDITMPPFSSLFDLLEWIDDWRASKDSNDRVYVIS
nr:hypothetical protein [Tanacetum cinerariifolium]